MEKTLSVRTVLKDLNMTQYSEIFEKEEVSKMTNTFKVPQNTLIHDLQINLTAFFTLTNNDLITIGINESADRKKILELINDFSTPKKPMKLEPKNYLHRY